MSVNGLTRPRWFQSQSYHRASFAVVNSVCTPRAHSGWGPTHDRQNTDFGCRLGKKNQQNLKVYNYQRRVLRTASPSMARLVEPQIQLNEVEATLRQLLIDVAAYINPKKPSELRFTGGWVRDKLLGTESVDVDVAINDMTGFQFGLKMKEYLDLPGNGVKYGISNEETARGLHKIAANPEKSKHLETVTTKILGLDIDLVNLRQETYTEDSRNPQMLFGTPEQDALRRDSTINALFYNLQSQAVEDLTERGLEDMRNKIIRTPLEPYQTFKDDPLRVLRLIRFAARFDFSLDQGSINAMQDHRIQQALRAKISRERIGVELEKMMKGEKSYSSRFNMC